jgi:calcineurin-like phosphoesterase family protein
MTADYEFLRTFISDNMFITSDSHFGHRNLVSFEPIREKMQNMTGKPIETIMIERWNNLVPEFGSILHLGDFSWHDPLKWASLLNGNKLLLKGNHDHSSRQKYKEAGFITFIKSQILFIDGKISILKEHCKGGESCLIADIGKHRILFSHIPFIIANKCDEKFQEDALELEELFKEFNCDLNIHGHVHSKETNLKSCRNVCVDARDFRPIKINELLADFFKNV